MAGPKPRCKKRVFSGARADTGGHLCGNYAMEGSDFCRVHGPQTPPEDVCREALTPPEVSSSQRTTYFSSLTWTPGQGPIVRPPYREGFGFITKALAKATDDGPPDITVTGLMRKRDGTVGVQTWEAGWKGEEALPQKDLDTLLRMLEEERRG